MLLDISNYLASAILGIMIFFSFILAPVTFGSLNEENARKFIRKIFPFYYNFNLILSLLTLIIFIYLKSYGWNFYLMSSVAILFVLSSFVLMPLINKYRDNNKQKKFKFSHFISVVINFLQMIFLTIILI